MVTRLELVPEQFDTRLDRGGCRITKGAEGTAGDVVGNFVEEIHIARLTLASL